MACKFVVDKGGDMYLVGDNKVEKLRSDGRRIWAREFASPYYPGLTLDSYGFLYCISGYVEGVNNGK